MYSADSIPTKCILCVSFSTKLPTPVENCLLWRTDLRKRLSICTFQWIFRHDTFVFHSICEKSCEEAGFIGRKQIPLSGCTPLHPLAEDSLQDIHTAHRVRHRIRSLTDVRAAHPPMHGAAAAHVPSRENLNSVPLSRNRLFPSGQLTSHL